MSKLKQILDYWTSLPIRTVQDLNTYLDSYRILFAYHSGKIENENITYHNTRELFEKGQLLTPLKDPKTVFEMQNQKICYEYLANKIITKEPITTEFIKEVHTILTNGTYDETRFIQKQERPGEYKKHDHIIGQYEVGAAPEEVSARMEELVEDMNDTIEENNILLTAAYFHAKFENIHPFADGNGRLGRTLLNYFFMIHDYPPLIIYEEDRQLYYECLLKFDTKETIQPLIEFLTYELEKTWNHVFEKKCSSRTLASFL